MFSSEPGRLRIDVRPSTEVTLLDARFREVPLDGLEAASDEGGTYSLQLRPGLYTLRFREGDEVEEHRIEIKPEEVTVRQSEPLRFSSPIPLAGAATSRSWHQDPAVALSERRRRVGQGSGLFVFVRDLGEPGSEEPTTPAWATGDAAALFRQERPDRVTWSERSGDYVTDDVGRGLAVVAQSGEEVARFKSAGPDDVHCAGVNLELDPGCWYLRLNLGLRQLVLPVITCPGWQTQVFLGSQWYPETDDRRPALDKAAIVMARLASPFNPADPDMRLAEAARLALVTGGTLLDAELRRLTRLKFENPILGICAAHLLLRRQCPDLEAVREVIGKTSEILETGGPPHPDLVALRCALAQLPGEPLATPPMLRASWAYLVRASRDWPDLVPGQSVASIAALHAWGHGAWLIWDQAQVLADLRHEVPLGSSRSVELLRSALSAGVTLRAEGVPLAQPLQTLLRGAPPDGLQRELLEAARRRHKSYPVPGKRDEGAVSAALDVPVSTVRSLAERLLQSIASSSRRRPGSDETLARNRSVTRSARASGGVAVAELLEKARVLAETEKNELIVGIVSKMTVMGLSNLVKSIEQKFDVKATYSGELMVATPKPAPVDLSDTAQTEFDLVLRDAGQKRIAVIKEVCGITKLDLKDAKDLVNKAPVTIRIRMRRAEADEAKALLEDAGADIELK